MPTMSEFYGITIMMYLRNKEHNPPHVHAYYGGHSATFCINDGELYEGYFPRNGKKLVKEFIIKYKDKLNEMWKTGKYEKLKGLE